MPSQASQLPHKPAPQGDGVAWSDADEPSMKSKSPAWPTLSRVVAALIGGYLFTYAFTAALARLLPMDKVDALVVASLPSFLIYTLAILWAFACRNAWRAWAGMALALPLAAVGFWPHWREVLG
jgi:hypothetical protein